MKIAIIGSGNIGGGLAKAWRRAEHEVTFGARRPEDPELQALCRETGAKAVPVADAPRDAEVVVLATPWAALDEVLEAVGDLAGKVVVDTTNAVAPGMKLRFGPDTSASEELQKRLPSARVVRAFNAQGAENLENPVYGGVKATNFLCGDDPAARKLVGALVEQVGFESVDVGPLRQSRLLDPLMVLWINAAQALGTRDLAFKLLRR